ncbi:exodeoxyribonuclease VII large subunit [Psychrosphaera sp. 1_MG-2023]|uniref:exodeoxyribonuclease VII large subunit n=1 Tax=Psychrosphaera sp. 1_MG-2023 TaxID=3062643 RepID=UPI0026E15C05|nr:exodeoxyribonuclease VII large subunit [Psychrosphaera sp. 1_MG-2023]MDO6719290.1 exodeoxyribonuclease VII large subunit [Psychrosphaera sp. 1_MG-2023]
MLQSYSSPQQKIYQVSELNQKVRMMLEAEFVNVWISAEISNLVRASSGHWYFSLKDNRAQVKAAMFKGNNRSVRGVIDNGSQVLVRGRISLYEPRGDYQFIVETMEPAGEGLLKQQFEALKLKLGQMGLFDQDVKRPIPQNPKRVGVITSPTGAAVHDILTVLKRRSPQTEVIIYPTMVQGEHAAQNLIWAINAANYREEVDVLVVGRGGGSLEDLWSFNDEALAHTIYNSALPIISAVGHEVDFSICDFVADLRAPTPSAAAELVSTDMTDVIEKVNRLYSRLILAYTHNYKSQKQQLSELNKSLSLLHPSHKIQLSQQKTDELQMRMTRIIQTQLSTQARRVEHSQQRLLSQNPTNLIKNEQQKLVDMQHSLQSLLIRRFERAQQRFEKVTEKLNIVSPLATLGRGYAIAMKDNGEVIKSPKQVVTGENINIRLTNDSINVVVK